MDQKLEAARLSGIAWADREAEMLRDQGRTLPTEWQGMTSDALACLPDDEDEEAREALAEEVNRAAKSRWEDIVTAVADLVTDEQIEALRRESDDAGDQVMCCICFVALGEEFARAAERTQLDDEQAKRAEQWLSQAPARRECARVIQAAAAMNDD